VRDEEARFQLEAFLERNSSHIRGTDNLGTFTLLDF
jgi:hypothetical protein